MPSPQPGRTPLARPQSRLGRQPSVCHHSRDVALCRGLHPAAQSSTSPAQIGPALSHLLAAPTVKKLLIAYLDFAIQQTLRFRRKHRLGHDQPKSVVERVRHQRALEPAYSRKRTASRLDQSEVKRLVQTTYCRTAVGGRCVFGGLDFAETLAFARLRPTLRPITGCPSPLCGPPRPT
jgi:hypothetical protein